MSTFFRKYLQKISGSPFLQQRKFITFIFFLVLSALFWLIRALDEEYDSSVDYPVRYINFPENKVLIGEVPYKLHLNVHARGFSILKSKLNLDLVPLRFNVNSFSLNSKGVDTFFVVTETVKDVLSSELNGMTILDISPDTLFFKLTGITVKKVAVIAQLSLHDKFFQQQYMLNGTIHAEPDSIIISGPTAIVDSILRITTEPIRYTNLADTVKDKFELHQIELVTFSQQQVEVEIPVDRFTEVEKMLTVVAVNVPDSLSMIAIPGQISITYRICLSNYTKVIDNPIVPRIDYNQVKENTRSYLTVFLTDTPTYISNLQFTPKVTEFLITRK